MALLPIKTFLLLSGHTWIKLMYLSLSEIPYSRLLKYVQPKKEEEGTDKFVCIQNRRKHRYLVGVSVVVAAHSLLQLLISATRLLKGSPVIPSRNYAWLIFAGDQVFAYASMSAGSASSGVTNLNRTGIRHTALPNFCKPLHHFCDHVAVSIAFTFFSCILLAASAVLDVIWLSRS